MNVSFITENRKMLSYTAYRELIDRLLSENKTTGENHSEAYINYTQMNVVRMKRWDKTSKIHDNLIKVLDNVEPQRWIVLTEAWCGDAAQNIPWLVKIAESSDNIQIEFLLRDENLDVIDRYLTNNGRSIPKLIAINSNNEELFTWGPRPTIVQNAYLQLKAEGKLYEEISETIHKMYAKDKGISLQNEFIALFECINKEVVL